MKIAQICKIVDLGEYAVAGIVGLMLVCSCMGPRLTLEIYAPLAETITASIYSGDYNGTKNVNPVIPIDIKGIPGVGLKTE